MPTIRALEAVPLKVGLVDPFVIANARLDRVENLAVRVALEDSAGESSGWGEIATLYPVTTETYADAVAGVERAAGLCGEAIPDDAALAERLRGLLPRSGAVRAGIEMAWWDARARADGIPLFRRAGGGPQPPPVMTDITLPIASPERTKTLAAHWRRLGFTTLKIKVGTDLGADLDRIAAVSEAHPSAQLVLDANEGWTVEIALEAMAYVRRHGIHVALLEQPVHRDDLESLARLTKEAGALVAADEAARSAADVRALAAGRVASAVNVKIAKCGVHEAIAMIEEARRHGLQTMIGAMVETRLGTGFSAHIAAGLGGFAVIDLDTSQLLADDPIAGGPALRGPRWSIDPGVAGHGMAPAADRQRTRIGSGGRRGG